MRRGQHHLRAPFNDQAVVVYDIETIVEDEPVDGSFPPWPRHQPVAAAFLSVRWTPAGHEFRLNTLTCADGAQRDFYEKVDKILAPGVSGVSFNGRGFDNRVLAFQASLHCPNCNLPGIARQALADRFDGAHRDLAEVYSGFGATRSVSLAELCRPLGIPIKTATDGSEVGALWRAGEHKRVRDYVREDVLATYVLHLHSLAFERSDEKLMMLPLAELAAWIETEPGLSPLKQFAECRPARLARERAPALRVGAALADAERRLGQERDEAAFAAAAC